MAQSMFKNYSQTWSISSLDCAMSESSCQCHDNVFKLMLRSVKRAADGNFEVHLDTREEQNSKPTRHQHRRRDA